MSDATDSYVPLTEEQKLRFHALKGERCPYCGDSKINRYRAHLQNGENGAPFVTVQCECLLCEQYWRERYDLSLIVEMDDDGNEITDDEEDGDAEDCGD